MLHKKIPLALLLIAGSASANPATLTHVGQGIGVTDISENGSVFVGNTVFDGIYETWRWVDGDPNGWTRLGRSTGAAFGTGAGSPDVSYDGREVSATITDENATYTTVGIWSADTGEWTDLFPPLPTDCVLLDNAYASAWGLSGDGSKLTGFYWRSTQGGQFGSAHASISDINGTHTPLPTANNRSGRVNASNYDGTIVAGWEATPTGPWRPVAWRNGTRYVLSDTPVTCQAEAMSADGNYIVGVLYDASIDRRNAGLWTWDGTQYVETDLGALPGTPQAFLAYIYATGVTDDGSMVVGVNRFQNSGPLSTSAGFVWTQAEGMRDVVDVMADHGISLPSGHMVVSMAISPDGSSIGLMTRDTNNTSELDYHTYRFRFPFEEFNCPGDIDGNDVVDLDDFNILAINFGSGPGAELEDGDLNDDGYVDLNDFNLLAINFGSSCS